MLKKIQYFLLITAWTSIYPSTYLIYRDLNLFANMDMYKLSHDSETTSIKTKTWISASPMKVVLILVHYSHQDSIHQFTFY